MRIAALYHVAFEKLGYIEDWIIRQGHSLSEFHPYEGGQLPSKNDFDLLIVMGGPMSVNEEERYSWLKPEKELIRESIHADKCVLGICLGAQLIADVMNARVYPAKRKEIGWFPVRFNNSEELKSLFTGIPGELTVFHWHGDTFDLPRGAVRLGESDLTPNQGFVFRRNVLAIQFHVEMKPENVSLMINHVGNELVADQYVQEAGKIAEGVQYLPEMNKLMDSFLNHLEQYIQN